MKFIRCYFVNWTGKEPVVLTTPEYLNLDHVISFSYQEAKGITDYYQFMYVGDVRSFHSPEMTEFVKSLVLNKPEQSREM